MIRYALKCDKNHAFDSWFQSADAFDKLLSNGLVACSVCGSGKVEKTVMAPQVQTARKKASSQVEAPAAPTARPPGPLSQPATPAEQAFAELRRQIEETSENVGRNFAREARAIHSGDAPQRPIIGEARLDEARSLLEDGVPVAPLPWGNNRKSN